MSDLETVLSRAVNVARQFGATRLLLFGSALENPAAARDLDLACAGVPGWKFFELSAALEELLGLPLDIVPLDPPTPLHPAARKTCPRALVTAGELKAEISLELEAMRQLTAELDSLSRDVAGREPTVRERTAAAAFLAQFYTGVENILKRLSRFYGVMLPAGENWHFDLYKRFCLPGHPPLPVLFDDELSARISPFRRFRHVVHHGYGFQIE